MSARAALFLSYASIMMSSIFIPGYALALGASMVEIGIISTSYGISLFLSSYIFSRASDIKGRKVFVVSGLLFSAVAFLLQMTATNPFLLLLVRSFAGFSVGIFTAPLIVYAFESGDRMGTFSSYGSMGWAAGSLLAGVIAQKSESLVHLTRLAPFWSVFFLSSLLFLISFFTVSRLPETKFTPRRLPFFPKDVFLKNANIYVSAFLRYFGANLVWVIFPLFLADLGANKLWIGIIYFVNAAGQVVIMRRLDFGKETSLVKIGLLLSSAVFFSYTLAPDYRWIVPLQVLLAFSYSFLYVGDLLYLTKRNEERGVAVGILNSVIGVCGGLGPIFGGVISQIWGFTGVMHVASAFAFIAFLVMMRRGSSF